MIDSLPPSAPTAPPDIAFSDEVAIEFHEGAARGVWWATLHVGPQAIEVGSVRGDDDLDDVLTMAAGILMERSRYADLVYISPAGDRLVLIGCWVLNARMGSTPTHKRLATGAKAKHAFQLAIGGLS